MNSPGLRRQSATEWSSKVREEQHADSEPRVAANSVGPPTDVGRRLGERVMRIAMQDEESAFLASVREGTATLSATCPGFEVFEVAESKLLGCIRDLGFQSFSGPDYVVMHRLREELERRRSDDALWALVYIDLWNCSNFHGVYWRELVLRDRRNIRLAIQAALYVRWESGSDSSAALTALIEKCSCRPEAQEYLETLSKRPE